MKLLNLFYCLLAITLVSCHKDDDIEVKERTILSYMVAENNLNTDLYENIDQMASVYDGTGYLMVYIDPAYSLNGGGVKPRLIRLSKTSKGVEQVVVKTYEEQNSASSEVLNAVIRDVKELAPSNSFGLILASHANGWLPANSVDTYSFGLDKNSSMDINDIVAAIDERLDFIMFDACFMSCAEVAYDFKNLAKYFIGSVAEVPTKGFPYNKMINNLMEAYTVSDYEEVCRLFYDNYKDGLSGCTVSLLQLDAMDALAASIKDIISKKYAEIDAITSVQTYDPFSLISGYDNMISDLDDFISKIADASDYSVFKSKLNDVVKLNLYTSFINMNEYYNISSCCGLSSFIPKSNYSKINSWYSNEYEWANACGLKDYISHL